MRRDAVRLRSLRLPSCISGLFILILAAAVPTVSAAGPTLYPSTLAGWNAQVLDERDTAPYLAYHKAEAMRRQAARGELLGRATANQAVYDARFYDLDLTVNPSTSTITGSVLTRATVVSGPLTTLDLDLDNLMTVSGVTSGGVAATFSHLNDVLTVNLDRSYATGELVDVRVNYSGNPASGGAFGWDTYNGQSLVWTLSEPYGGRTWWPSKDWSDDKADSVHVRVVAPTGYITASNGKLVESTDNGANSIYRWRERYPIATYLVSITSYPYAVYSDWYHPTPSDSMEIKFFNFPDHVGQVQEVQAKVKTMIGAYAGIFGEYPFLDEKYGHAEFLWGGGMEHQTCTSLGYFGESVVAHELAHQWWGDMVTCADFHHVWLNEGFATYGEALWVEHNSGIGGYHQDINFNAYYGPGTIYVPNLNDWNRIFDGSLSYNKASWVLHMLRHVLGDDDFFASLRAYYDQYKYSVATTENFRDVCEAVSGQDLDYFFQEWIYGEYYPSYKYTYTVTPAGGGYDVALNLLQTQSWQIFRMPVDVTIQTATTTQTFVVDNSLASQDYQFHVDEAPTNVSIDKDGWILKQVQAPIVNPAFDRGVLVVNGIDWGSYGSELTTAYLDKAFWGDYSIDFWDVFGEPGGGYPNTLPAPLGHGSVPPEVIGHYRNVIWVGNNFNGDLSAWLDSPIMSYLEVGGNLILMARQGSSFLSEPLRSYLGLTWISETTIFDCVASYPGLTNIPRLGTQSLCGTFNMSFNHLDSRLIYMADQNFNPNRGIGVWREPIGGGTYRPDGGQFVFLSGRPYRWDHAALRTNIMYMLEHFFLEPVLPPADATDAAVPSVLRLEPSRPNPFAAATTIRFALPAAGPVRLELLDVTGRVVRRIAEGSMAAGTHTLDWNGADASGHPVPAGVYWARLRAQGQERTQKLTILR
jgi:aminopeptidase N